MTLSSMVSEALRYLGNVRNYAPTTVDSYQRSFDLFRHYLQARGLTDEIRHFTGDHVRGFDESLAAAGQKPSSRVIRLGALSTIAQTLMKLKTPRGKPYLTHNPARMFEWPTVDAAETKFLLPDELAAFLSVARPLRESIVRDVFLDTGARVSELCRLNVGDVITVAGATALATTVKGRRSRLRKRHLPLSQPIASAMIEYLMARGISNPQDAAHRDQPLFLTSTSERWKRTGLSSLMVRIGRQAGVSRFRVSAHKLRHTANVVARLARREDGAPLDRWTRSQLLSHANPSSLDRYEHLLPVELFEAREAQRAGLAKYLGPPAGLVRSDPVDAPRRPTSG